jgi:hypothetical protein
MRVQSGYMQCRLGKLNFQFFPSALYQAGVSLYSMSEPSTFAKCTKLT